MSVPVYNAQFIWQVFVARLTDPYVYGGVWSPTDASQGCDCSGLVGTVLEALTKGRDGMNWDHDVSTEAWFYDYNTDTPAAPGTVGPYGTIAIASPADLPADAALLICIMHGGGGEDSHMNCLTPQGQIMESNGDEGTCTNGTGGTPADSNIWTDWHYLPGPIDGGTWPAQGGPVQPPLPPARGANYTVQPGDTFSGIADQFGVTLSALEAANPGVTDPDQIWPGQVIAIP